MLNFYWLQKNILDRFGLVFVGMFEEENTADWPSIFPKKIWVVSKKTYSKKFPKV